MADFTQAQSDLITHQAITHPANVIGGAVSVATYLSGTVYIWQANIETTANLAAGLDYIAIQTCPDATGNNWTDYVKLTASTTASASEALSDAGGEAAGTTVLVVADTTGFTAGDLVYVTDAADANNGEWGEVVSIVANTSVTLADGLIDAKAQNDVIYDQASRWSVNMDFAGVQRIRVIIVHQGATGSDWRVKAVLEAATDLE